MDTMVEVPSRDLFKAKMSNSSSMLDGLVKRRMLHSSRHTEVVECSHKSDSSATLVLLSRRKEGMDHSERMQASTEISILQSLAKDSMPGIVKTYAAFETEDAYCQIMDNYQSNLDQEMKDAEGFNLPEEEVCNDILQPLLTALACLHRKQIVHRNVRLQNLLIGEEGVRLTGFKLAQGMGEISPTCLAEDAEYNAPEMIQALEAGSSNEVVSCNEKVDIWAAGVVTYKLLFGQCPFCSESEKELKRLIVEGSLPGFMGFLSADCQDFLHLVLRKKADERPSAESLLKHPWLTHHLQLRSKKEPYMKSDEKEAGIPLHLNAPWITNIITPNQSLSPRMGTWKISSHTDAVPGDFLMSSDSETSAALLAHLDLHSNDFDADREGADDILPRSPIRRQTSCSSSRASSEILSYVDAAPQLEDLREEAAAESALRPSITPDLIHLESLGSTEANAAPSLLPTIKHVRRQGSLGKSRFAWTETERSP